MLKLIGSIPLTLMQNTPSLGPILKNGIVLESSHQTLLIHAIGVIVEHGRLAENA